MADGILNRLFPKEPDKERQQYMFLELCYSHNWNMSKISEKTKISRRGLQLVLAGLRHTPVFERFCRDVSAQMGDFFEESFIETMFRRYESEYLRLDRMIQTAENNDDRSYLLQLLRIKHQLMFVQLRAAMACQQLKLGAQIKEANAFTNKYRSIYEEAINEYGIQSEAQETTRIT